MARIRQQSAVAIYAVLVCLASTCEAEERRESFDREPGWVGVRNRPSRSHARKVRQDFGFSPTRNAQGTAEGELGGWITPAAEAAYVAKPIPPRSLQDSLSAAGTFLAEGRQFHVLLGFFHTETLNEWRTPNTIALRLYGRGDRFFAYVEYATARWRAGGDAPVPFPRIKSAEGREESVGFAARKSHKWSLQYDPLGNQGQGVVTASIDGVEAICELAAGHKLDGARFNRCGLMTVMKHLDSGGTFWIDDMTILGDLERFSVDPGWDAFQNRREYTTHDIRPQFNFGYSDTQFAGGAAVGELGGLVFRGDCRELATLASYADRVGPLSLDRSLRAKGRVALRRGVSDSTTLLGFFDSKKSLKVNASQRSGIPDSFLGLAIEGPSREGFFMYPVYRVDRQGGVASGPQRPRLVPDGRSHQWSFCYAPSPGGRGGRIRLALAGESVELPVAVEHRSSTSRFDRFGLLTTWIDGNGQVVFFDDLSYTWR
ncbi:MAG: hypothetical protein VX346_28055 [Planctomycetota bacterium]|nr:hypothetical protein [Planctomycetota bacterium]